MRKLILLGANNPEAARQARALMKCGAVHIEGFLDNDAAKHGTDFCGFPVFGGFEVLPEWIRRGVEFVNLITRDTRTRHQTTRVMIRAGAKLGQFIHPSVDLTDVQLGLGSYIQQDAILQAAVRLGHNCSVSAGAIINHECSDGDSVFLAPGANLCGKITVGDGVFVGASSVVLPRLTIGAWSTIGAGAVVSQDVSPGAVMVGNPARPARYCQIEEESLDV